jgi:hypothetical protein
LQRGDDIESDVDHSKMAGVYTSGVGETFEMTGRFGRNFAWRS